MIIDTFNNLSRYTGINERIAKAITYLHTTDFSLIKAGKYIIEGENLFAMVQEYETLDVANEQMEAHKKYIDIQYMIRGEELIGLALMKDQNISKPYDEDTDFMLFNNEPSFFAKLAEGTFMIFFPTDLHMPCIKTEQSIVVKKVVIKVRL